MKKNLYFMIFIVALLFVKNGGDLGSTKIIEPSVRCVLSLVEPAEKPLGIEKILEIIPDKDGREKFAIFNNEFAERSKKYNGTAQKYNDVYVKAASLSFKDEFKKYTGLKDYSISYMQNIISSKDKFITEEEKGRLFSDYKALSWTLGE